MNTIHGLILGLVEGLTEFLPISSTAHLILAQQWLRLPSSEFLKTFSISIQLGAIIAVVIMYWRRVLNNREIIGKVMAAFVPTAIIGLALYGFIKRYLLDSPLIIAWALIIGGVLIILLEKYYAKRQIKTEENNNLANISYSQAILIGFFQTLAIIPGVSRSGATIMGGLGLGIRRQDIVEFSFLLAIPTMAAATGLDLIKTNLNFSPSEIAIWVTGFITAFITAILGIKFFLRFIQKNDFTIFGWYRIGLGLIVLIWLFI